MKKILNYLLIHGAWHGSWCFTKYITPILEQSKNVKVYACNLPGHYTNKSIFNSINLNTYVNYVSDLIQNNIKENVILVAHSMGGIVASQIAQNLPKQVSHIVYISAFIPSKNGSLIEEEQKSKFPSVALKVKIDKEKYSINLDTKDCIELFYQKCKEKDIEYAIQNLQSQPLLPFLSKVELGVNFDNVRKTYIECLQDNAIHIVDQRRMNIICDKIYSIDTDHSPFFSAYEELASILSNVDY